MRRIAHATERLTTISSWWYLLRSRYHNHKPPPRPLYSWLKQKTFQMTVDHGTQHFVNYDWFISGDKCEHVPTGLVRLPHCDLWKNGHIYYHRWYSWLVEKWKFADFEIVVNEEFEKLSSGHTAKGNSFGKPVSVREDHKSPARVLDKGDTHRHTVSPAQVFISS